MSRTLILEKTGSTNDELKNLIACGDAFGGDAVVAYSQDGGRGRLGRTFFSPRGGIYVSVYVTPDLPPEQMPVVSAMAAAAVCRALDTVGVTAGIKWINDLILKGKKLGGILCEGIVDDNMHICGAVIGVGLNCFPEGTVFPDELADIAVGIEMDENDRKLLTDALIAELRAISDGTAPDWYLYYRERSVVLDRRIKVIPNRGEPYFAVVRDIEVSGTLTVETDSGEYVTLGSGEISIRPESGTF
ncbi:MAG: biotin--[Clostridia bacterium]|nr:biotin--[acetyl-CoA-carboxylase] ligase [Clostridia bacterium]